MVELIRIDIFSLPSHHFKLNELYNTTDNLWNIKFLNFVILTKKKENRNKAKKIKFFFFFSLNGWFVYILLF